MRKKIYIAGPYSSNPVLNTREAIDMWNWLWNNGFAPFCPHLTMFIDMIHNRPYEEWLDYDNQWVPVCDALLRIPGPSSGADKEVELAESLGKPVFFNVEELMEWSDAA